MIGILLFAVTTCVDSITLSSRPVALKPMPNGVVRANVPIENFEASLPWTDSIVPSKTLSYMPVVETQLAFMESMNFTRNSIHQKFTYQTSTIKPARIGSMSFSNSVFRNVRMTYFDAGDAVQVYNTVWSPHYSYDLPMLGIDLISLGRSRVLTVIDLQPLHPTQDYADKYISPLTSIRAKYPNLQGTLSGKIYDDTSFFSKNMLFGRFTDESKLSSDVHPAMTEYLTYYTNLASITIPNEDPASKAIVHERQKAYDVYSALKDPAVGLFDSYFGKEWSSDFVHQFLFPLSARDDNMYTPPVHNFKIPSS